MPERVDARDVLDANAGIKRAFTAAVVGYFKRTGIQTWDDYEFVRANQGLIETYPGTRIQLEANGTKFRMRQGGKVVRIHWTPGADDPEGLKDQTPAERRSYFVANYLQDYDDAPGMGAAALIARKLSGGVG